jgi:hypothetical protein
MSARVHIGRRIFTHIQLHLVPREVSVHLIELLNGFVQLSHDCADSIISLEEGVYIRLKQNSSQQSFNVWRWEAY